MTRSAPQWARRLAAICTLAIALTACTDEPGPDKASQPADSPGVVTGIEDLPREQWLPGTAKNQRLTYWSIGSDGNPAKVTGTLHVPTGKPPDGGWPVVSWTHGTVGLADKCKRSVAGRPESEATQLTAWLDEKYAIAATDYVGMGDPPVQPYLDAMTEGHNAVDIVRAAHNVNDDLADRWVVIGHSQGGQAALGTAAIASHYAPELDFRGAVSIAPATNVVDAMIAVTGPTPIEGVDKLTQHTAQMLAGLKAARSDWNLDALLTPTGKELVDDARQMCNRELAERAEGIEPSELLHQPLGDGDFAEVAHPVIDIPMTGYDKPILIAHGDADKTIPPQLTEITYDELREHDVDVTYHSYPGDDHVPVLASSLADTIPFVDQLLA